MGMGGWAPLNKDENPSTISTRHVKAKCKTQERKTKTINQNSSNEIKKSNAKMNGIEYV